MYAFKLVSFVLSLTCVVGEYVCLDNGTEIYRSFRGCQDKKVLLQSFSDEEETQLVVCRPLVDMAVALHGKSWSPELCPTVNVSDNLCSLVSNYQNWDAAFLSVNTIKMAPGCEKACGKVACDRLRDVIKLVETTQKPAAQPPGKSSTVANPVGPNTANQKQVSSQGKKPIDTPPKKATPTTNSTTLNAAMPTTEGTTPTIETKNPTTPTTLTTEGTTPTRETKNPTTPTTTHATPTTEQTTPTTPTATDMDLEGGDYPDNKEQNEVDEYDNADGVQSDLDDGATLGNQVENDEKNQIVLQSSGNTFETYATNTGEYEGHGSGFFFSLFLVIAILCVGGYLFWHNRKRVHDYFTDRRRGRRLKDHRPLLG